MILPAFCDSSVALACDQLALSLPQPVIAGNVTALYNPDGLGGLAMEVFIFIGKGGFCGAITEASGTGLPGVSGPWHFLKKTRLSQESGINRTVAISDIKAKGYHLVRPDRISGSFGSIKGPLVPLVN